ncbi:unnamed protein product [Rotaria socialis]|uniref:Uncharacterized protein n=1 Tax=Rotaria socialis TaxID=392032 RepID=A0A821GK08_9BILA|nr:unnamed protein product [Rotaria socialis]CAF4263332.1 unnamed protein product [Rotaria socialis]CAF4320043.1 unnamed protein product [Rotaria socialis]CAF4667591.1 unnamed protein product [Rotaria socialis]
MVEYKALELFEQITSPSQWNTHLFLKAKMKSCSTKTKNYLTATKDVEYDFTFKIAESILNKDEAQTLYNQMRQLTKDYRTQAMSLYLQSTTRFPKEENDSIIIDAEDDSEAEPSLYFLKVKRGFLALTIINKAKAKLTEDEYQLLKLGPRFIYNDPKAASRRRTTELTVLKRKIETRFFEKKWTPNLHDTPARRATRQYEQQHKLQDYHKKPDEYMEKTEVYERLHQNDPLPNLIEHTNKYLLNLRLKHWITQRQYEQLSVKPNEMKLTHLYYLPKVHKLGTPLRPILSLDSNIQL